MADTTEVNTQYLWTWLSNTEDVHNEAMRIADTGDLDELREYVTKELRAAPEGDPAGTHETSRNMSDDDMDTVDWDDIRTCLLS